MHSGIAAKKGENTAAVWLDTVLGCVKPAVGIERKEHAMSKNKKQAATRSKTRSFWCLFGTLIAATVLLYIFRHPVCIWFYVASLAFCEGYDADIPKYQQYLRQQPFKRWFLKKHTVAAYRRHCYGICVLCLFLAAIGLLAALV